MIAYASDGLISYNSEVSRQISEYINELKNSNTLHTASLESFVEYVKKKQELYKTNEGIEELRSVYVDAKRITNCIEVVDLLNIALDGNANVINFIEHYKSINNASTKMQKMNNIVNIMEQNTQYNMELFYNAILATVEKYGSEQAIEALMLYLNEGKANGFTSASNARNNIRQLSGNSINEICLKILGKPLNSKTEVVELVNNIIMSKSNTEELPIIQEISFTNYLEKSCYDSLMIYGIEQTIEAIKYAIENKSYNGFTRQNNARKNLKDNIAIENINSIVMQTLINNGYDLMCGYPDYIRLYIEYLSKKFGLDDAPPKR